MTIYGGGPNHAEHPRNTNFIKLENGGIKLIKYDGNGGVLFSHNYTDEEWGQITQKMEKDFVDVPAPKPAPAPEPTPDPAPRAKGGTPDTGPVKADAPKAKKDAGRPYTG